MDLEKVFKADPLSVERVIGYPGRGFYIPSYQRPYAWSPGQAVSLITSVTEGAQTLLSMEDAITFIGTFIFIHDTDYATVEPKVRGELPPQVYLVIDGQQRLTTLSLIAISLHDSLFSVSQRVKGTEDVVLWSKQQSQELLRRLERILALEIDWADGPWKWYPRIARAYDDSWGYSAASAKYRSPAAKLLAQYSKFVRESDETVRRKGFKFSGDGSSPENLLGKVFANIGAALTRLRRPSPKDDADELLPDLAHIASSPDYQRRFFQRDLPPAVVAELGVAEPNAQTKRLQELARLLLITRYLLDRVAVTQVLVNKEEYAFDMFEALNTTGEPLTAYETFKPRVINHEGLDGYQSSPSATHLVVVERFLDSYAERRQQACHRLLIPFALFETGSKLSKHLRDQRNWLRRHYDDSPTTNEKRKFIEGLAAVARFLTDGWPDRERLAASTVMPGLSLGNDANEVFMCMEVLRAANHHITVSLLARFFDQAVSAGADEKDTLTAEFADAVRAITAFFALWRGSRVGTENIDSVYRALMARGATDVPAFSREATQRVRAADLQKALREALEGKKVGRKEAWVEKAAGLSVYLQSRELTRLLLLAATHDAIPDESQPGFTKSGKHGVCTMLSIVRWNQDLEIEHVAPQAPAPGSKWDPAIYTEELIDTLGNLTLLPRSENASVGNKGWEIKNLYFRILAADEDVGLKLIDEAAKRDITLPQPSQELLQQARYVPHVRALSLLPDGDGWTSEFVQNRSRHVAGRAWDRLAPWLGLR